MLFYKLFSLGFFLSFGYSVLASFLRFTILRLYTTDASFLHFFVAAYMHIGKFSFDKDADAQEKDANRNNCCS